MVSLVLRLLKGARVVCRTRVISDHYSILLKTGNLTWGPSNAWLKNDELITLVNQKWKERDRWTTFRNMEKLNFSKGKLKNGVQNYVNKQQGRMPEIQKLLGDLEREREKKKWGCGNGRKGAPF